MKLYDPLKTKLKHGIWEITLKIDGVQAQYRSGVPTSRNGKPLYNLPSMKDGDYEVFLGDFKSSISACRTHEGKKIPSTNLYRLEPEIDTRLKFDKIINPTPEKIMELMQAALERGFEGLVLRGPNGERLKVKDKDNYDVVVIGVIEGTGKFQGMMGALITPMGKVGTGFSNADRQKFWELRDYIEGCHNCAKKKATCRCPHGPNYQMTIEVECMELTPDGKFRHPRFVRIREDK